MSTEEHRRWIEGPPVGLLVEPEEGDPLRLISLEYDHRAIAPCPFESMPPLGWRWAHAPMHRWVPGVHHIRERACHALVLAWNGGIHLRGVGHLWSVQVGAECDALMTTGLALWSAVLPNTATSPALYVDAIKLLLRDGNPVAVQTLMGWAGRLVYVSGSHGETAPVSDGAST